MTKTEFVKMRDSLEVGDFFSLNGEIFIIACTSCDKYALICINDGYRWTDEQSDINEVFGSQKNHFTQINTPFVVTPE